MMYEQFLTVAERIQRFVSQKINNDSELGVIEYENISTIVYNNINEHFFEQEHDVVDIHRQVGRFITYVDFKH
jgi:hypothetical protein